jgi:hypothetical protein
MGIEFIGADGKAAPLITCDHCRHRIRNADGNAAYRYREDNRIDLDGPYFIHKACTASWEEEPPFNREPWLMDELDVWLGYLVQNAGYDPNTLADRVEVMDAFSHDPE